MKVSWAHRHRLASCRSGMGCARRWWRWLSVGVALATVVTAVPASASQLTADGGTGAGQYQVTVVRTAYGIPHITATDFASLGYGYGYSLASDDLCTMADGYLTVEGERSRYLGPNGNLDSDLFWQSVIDRHVIPRLLAIRHGPAAVGPQLRRLISGYVAGYNAYLASVGGAAGVPDPTCRGQAWVKPITALDAYLLIYQVIDMSGQAGDIPAITQAQPPASAGGTSATALTRADLSARAAAVVRTPPGTHHLPSVGQLRGLGQRLSPTRQQGGLGSNAIAVGPAGTRGGLPSVLLGNPHFPWQGIDRFYQVQLTIPGTLNVEGATLYGIPLVVIGFTGTMAWSHTVSTAWTATPYQLTLVPGDPTKYIFGGQAVPMTSQTVTVESASPDGTVAPVSRTLWSTRFGPVIAGGQMPWTAQTAFALADANAGNFRFLAHYLATDEARSVADELTALRTYQGLPWVNTIAADSTGHALYSDIQAVPHVTDAEAAQCDTALGAVSFQQSGLPILDGSRSACDWGTDPDSATPGIFGPAAEPTLETSDFVENSNDSYWLVNPAHPLTGFPRIIGLTGTDLGLRTRSALGMIMQRISGADGLGPPGFSFGDMKNLMVSDIQYGASLVRQQLVAMCRAFPGGMAPTSTGTIAVGGSCDVLAAWDGRENTGSRGAVLFRAFWERALRIPGDGPWTQQFDPADPLGTPNGLDTASAAVQQAFGNALAALTAAHLPYDVPLGTVQYALRNGQQIPLPGGPGDPDGEFNAVYEQVVQQPGVGPSDGSSYIQVVTWHPGDACPEAATLLTYSESADPGSPYYADQTELFSRSQWVTPYFCPAQVAAHAISTVVLHGG